MQRISRFRMIVFIIVILAMIGVFSLRLYKTQAAVTEDSLVTADADSMTYQSTVEAARGNILDRNPSPPNVPTNTPIPTTLRGRVFSASSSPAEAMTLIFPRPHL